MELKEIRVDKWLHAVRIYKSRTLASEACRTGKVKVREKNMKSSSVVKVGEVVHVRKGIVTYQFKVLKLLKNRVGAKLVPEYMKNVTPEEELLKLAKNAILPTAFRARGEGRPTKKERRELDNWREQEFDFDSLD